MTATVAPNSALTGGFAAPAFDSARAFREIMECMARPGRIGSLAGALPPAPLSPAAGAVLLTLCDGDTPVHLSGEADCAAARDWLSFHTGAPSSPAGRAVFALGRLGDLAPLDRFPMGTPTYPDRSATVIVEVDRLEAGGHRLTGPGIEEAAYLDLPDPDLLAAARGRFPLGLDLLFTCGSHIAALPRTTRIG